MTLLLSCVVAVLFGSGAYLLLKRDLLRVAVGTILLSNAANLWIMSAGLSRGGAPIYPIPHGGQPVSDPLVQALTLTAIVITFGTSGVLLSVVYRVYLGHGSADLQAISEAEVREEAELEEEERRG
jgi:multicomponent Na+:H+ antiporter subunit C